ncbi:sensor histidine kinase [Nitriliruptor alkaliphilus]|uniref:sensor histidine kinase n=1 Tax=Nitriliruptor alkaliphilus TaxID=427918 RepID=UPI000695D17C|nr:histidine kinase [Nitriliruptor alkaliphilus]
MDSRRRALEPRDLVLPAGLGVFALLVMFTAEVELRSPDAVSATLVIVSCAALALRRIVPLGVLLITCVIVVVYPTVGYPGAATALPVFVALHTAVEAGRRLPAWITAAATIVVGTIASTLWRDGPETALENLEQHLLIAGWVVASGVLGEVARQRRVYVAEVEARAAEAERTREQIAQRRVAQERLSIARELHDSLTHSISVIKVQSGVAVHLARKRGEEVPPALLAVQEASTDAIRELRGTLDVLRPGTVADEGMLAVGIERLPELVEVTRRSGLQVSFTITGRTDGLAPHLDRAVYRIVQESLTNVTRHAAASQVDVHVVLDDDVLTVRVADDGTASDQRATPPGLGITGMQERARALGGRLVAGPRPAGGFLVAAELPTTVTVP